MCQAQISRSRYYADGTRAEFAAKLSSFDLMIVFKSWRARVLLYTRYE